MISPRDPPQYSVCHSAWSGVAVKLAGLAAKVRGRFSGLPFTLSQ